MAVMHGGSSGITCDVCGKKVYVVHSYIVGKVCGDCKLELNDGGPDTERYKASDNTATRLGKQSKEGASKGYRKTRGKPA